MCRLEGTASFKHPVSLLSVEWLQVRERDSAFPCACAAILPKTDQRTLIVAFDCGAAPGPAVGALRMAEPAQAEESRVDQHLR